MCWAVNQGSQGALLLLQCPSPESHLPASAAVGSRVVAVRLAGAALNLLVAAFQSLLLYFSAAFLG